MSKYNSLWEYVQKSGNQSFKLTFKEIQNIAGIPNPEVKMELKIKFVRCCMNNTYDSEFSNVAYLEADNVVLLTWKKFCCFDNYRIPTMFASDLLKKYNGSNLVIDARNGFEDEKEDVEWGFRILLPDMSQSSCKKCIFILQELPIIEDEIDLWTAEFKKYFKVFKVWSYAEAIERIQVD